MDYNIEEIEVGTVILDEMSNRMKIPINIKINTLIDKIDILYDFYDFYPAEDYELP
jgi:hypothetical protein